MSTKSQSIKKASRIGILGNGFLAVLKIGAGIISGSFAVISDGLDTASDVLSFIITFYASKIICKPPDYKYPYGYQRAEAIATKVLSFIIFFVGAQLFYTTLIRIIEGQPHAIPTLLAIYVTIVSIVFKVSLSIYQFRVGKKVNSPMVIANAKNMRNDILISGSVLLGLFFTHQLNLPVLDLIIAMAVSIWIMKEGFLIFMESNVELMDGVDDSTVYYKIFDAVEEVEGAHNPHRVRLRKHADQYVIALDVEVDPEITIARGHKIAKEVENNIKGKITNTYDVMVHTEPLGNVEQEKFGLSRKRMKKYKK
jgi:cation diffusion facilitator family transporter